MKHNWKYICRTAGYQSLKQAYREDTMNQRMRDKEEYYRLFRQIICAAEKVAIRENTGLDDILNRWERMRDGWWYGHYSNHNDVRNFGHPLHPMGIRGIKKLYTTQNYSLEHKAARIQAMIRYKQKQTSTRPLGRKPRWTSARRKRAADSRKWHEEYAKLHPAPESVS